MWVTASSASTWPLPYRELRQKTRPRERLVERHVVRARDCVGGLLDVLLDLGRPHLAVLRVLEVPEAAAHERRDPRDVRRGQRGPLQVAVARHRLAGVGVRFLERPYALSRVVVAVVEEGAAQ